MKVRDCFKSRLTEREIEDRRIVYAVRQLGSAERLGRAVYARDVWDFCHEFDVYAVEATIRRHMARLANEGRLIRVGERGGYEVPDWRTYSRDRKQVARSVESVGLDSV